MDGSERKLIPYKEFWMRRYWADQEFRRDMLYRYALKKERTDIVEREGKLYRFTEYQKQAQKHLLLGEVLPEQGREIEH